VALDDFLPTDAMLLVVMVTAGGLEAAGAQFLKQS
jgi:hypothetical protein